MKNRNYLVKIAKTFKYPLGVLNKSDKRSDAYAKAYNDIQDIYTRKLKKEEVRGFMDMFEVTFEEEPLIISYRKPLLESLVKTPNGVEIEAVAKVLTDYEMESKYGELNEISNSNLFIFREALIDVNNAGEDVVLREGKTFLKPGIEDEYQMKYHKFMGILSRAKIFS